ncbi:MAG TPA: hypothetical protein VIH61_07995, partial [Waddliaceae bacterium]
FPSYEPSPAENWSLSASTHFREDLKKIYWNYVGCRNEYLQIRQCLDKRVVTAQQIADAQNALNDKYKCLLAQYQDLEQKYLDEKKAHAEETAQMLKLIEEIKKIKEIFAAIGLT